MKFWSTMFWPCLQKFSVTNTTFCFLLVAITEEGSVCAILIILNYCFKRKKKKKKNEMKVEENVYLLNAFNLGNGKHRFM